ncbi:hypothetical protein [Bacillus sp. EB600]|uniref:hypothetical protein n=1 Tax=Bacillus sp. EB600 TaxID=2806345 RepID=UPI00210BBB32|nr:hypothetical protein [Bacillus sp. EB600]MCQ6282336.1 hypothetical protein [Bacillus sp. EB600]
MTNFPRKMPNACVPRQTKQAPKTCQTCGCNVSACNCKFQAPVRVTAPLNSNCTLVNSVVCSKDVQKVAELTLPITAFAGLVLADIVSINVVPNLAGITANARIIKDKVVNIGLIPVTITITVTTPGVTIAPLTTTIPFQAETDCPGACPEDTLVETPLQVEGIFVQPGVPIVTGPLVGALVTGILFKIILRTTITVVRPLLVDEHGNFCDVTDRCITTGTPATITLPTPPTTGLLGG